MNYEEYQKKMGNSRGIGASGKTMTPIENEKFHSVYIGGKTRKNEIGVEEYAGKIHIRGVESNLDKVNCILLTSKLVNVKEEKMNGKNRVTCFSYRDTIPNVGTDNNYECLSSTDRRNDEHCSTCRSHIIICGILTNEQGKPKLTEDNKPILIFIRGRGVKYTNVSDYLYSLTEMDMEPFFGGTSDEEIQFEKNNVNMMRVVTSITKGTTNTTYGEKDIFNFNIEEGAIVSRKMIERLIKLSSEIVDDFDEKFNWSKRKNNNIGIKEENQFGDFREEDMKKEVKKNKPAEENEESDPFAFEDDIPF